MGAALFITLERTVAGLDAGSVSGKFLSRNLESLDAIAGKLHVRPLSELISVNPDEAAAFLEGEGMDLGDLPVDLPLPDEQWFDADEGVKTVEALLHHVQSGPAAQDGLVEDLKACQKVLLRAKQEQVRFHFAVDF